MWCIGIVEFFFIFKEKQSFVIYRKMNVIGENYFNKSKLVLER